MIRTILTLTLITILAAACSPAATPPNYQPDPTQVVSELATVAPASTPTEQTRPHPTKEPNGKDPSIVPTSTNNDFITTEIAGRPTDTSITINVVPARDMQIIITYGTEGETRQAEPVAAKANTPTEISLINLTPDTSYFYSVNDGAKHTFHTACLPGSTFTFDIQGDSHPERVGKQFSANLYTKTLLSAASDQPDFYITIGDDFSVDALKIVTRETVTAQYINQRQWLGLVDAPVFLVNGNHEQASLANLDGTAENISIWAQTARNAYYPQPAPDTFYSGNPESVEHIGLLRNYYAWEWGDALFVVIDPYWHSPQTVDNQFGVDRSQKKNRNIWNVTLGEVQYHWFRQTLETSQMKYKFVFAHHVNGTGRGGIELANSFEWGDSANLAAHRHGWDRTIHQIMVDNGVTIFFQGHDHLFARQELDGVTYLTLPVPADPHYAIDNADAYLSGDILPASGHVRVTVGPDGVTVEYIRSYLDRPDEIAYSFTLP